MDDFAVTLYRKRREERLAARGIKIKKKQYRKGKDGKRLTEPERKAAYHNDDDGEESQQNNGSEGGSHGNTRLPFGLCLKYGIEIGAGWTPHDAWEALAGKGITPDGIYRKLKAGEELGPDEAPEPPKKEPVKTIDGGDKYYYKDLRARTGWGRRGATPWVLEGTPEWRDEVPEEERHGYRSSWLGRFATTTDLYFFLKEKGIEEFVDPETGEVVNPVEMELPKRIWSDGERGYSALTIGMKKDRYAIVGTDFEGKKKTIQDFRSLAAAEEWLAKRGVAEDDFKLSPALKKREKERVSWLTSDIKEWVESDGVRYGDLKISRDYYGDYTLRGEDESGQFLNKEFKSRTDLIKYLKDQGVQKVRDIDKSVLNPQDYDIPDAVATIDGKAYQKLEIAKSRDTLVLYGTDLDGSRGWISDLRGYDTTESFFERLKTDYGITDDILEIDDDTKAYIAERRKAEEERDRRRKEFAEKAVPVGYSKFMDIFLEKDGSSFKLNGYDEYGRMRNINSTFDMGDMIQYMEKYNLNPEEIIKDTELKNEFRKIQELRKDFETKSEQIGSYRYTGVELIKTGSEYCLIGYDINGKRHSLTYSVSDLYSVAESAESKGVTDLGKYALSPEVKKDWEAHLQRIAEFESKAVTLSDGRKYADMVLVHDSGHDYVLKGYDSRGRLKSVTGYGKSMYDTVQEAEGYGLKMEDMQMESPEVRKAYDEYKRVKEKFDTESRPFDGKKYMDLKLGYDGIWYRIRGTDAKGRRVTIAESTTATEIQKQIDGEKSGEYSFDTFEKSDEMKERMKVLQKARDAIATGEYYDMGIDGTAFKSIHADKIGDKWSIKGIDIDGKEKQIVETIDWDDTVETLERFGVKDYKLLTKDRTYDRPTDGMRHVVLMKSPDGMYKVFADTDTKGKHAEVHSCTTEEEARQYLSDNNVDSGNIRTRGMNPNDDKPRTHTQRSLESFDTYRMKRLDGSFIDDMTAEEKQLTAEMLQTVFDQGSYRVARSTSSMAGIIENGYKSQIEVGKGGYGAFKGKDGRKRASETFFGHSGLDDTEYEKCGYVGLKDEAEDWDDYNHPGYGGNSPLTYTLRKETVQDRTTYTYGDSLNTRHYMTSAGYAGPNPTIEGISSLASKSSILSKLEAFKKYKNGEISYQEMFREIRRSTDNGYIELQFHGPVTVKDIERISFNTVNDLDKAFGKMGKDRKKRVVQLLKENNVDLVYRENRSSKFQDAWAHIRENFPEAFED